MHLQINDYVMVPQPKATMDEHTNYLYGKVIGFNHGTAMAIIELHKPYLGVNRMTMPSYMVSTMTVDQYELMTDPDQGADLWQKASNILLSGQAIPPVIADEISLGEPQECWLGRDSMKCDHNWIPAGRSFLTDKMWYDCKICGEKKGG